MKTKPRIKRNKPLTKFVAVNPLDKKYFGSQEDQARAFRLVMRHGIYPIIAIQPMVGLGGGVDITARGSTWPEAVDNLCRSVGLNENNHYHDLIN